MSAAMIPLWVTQVSVGGKLSWLSWDKMYSVLWLKNFEKKHSKNSKNDEMFIFVLFWVCLM